MARWEPQFSHLAFVDDVIMFAEASVDQISLMENILHSFCRCSREKVSEEKTHVFFSKDVLRKLWQQICLVYGF